MPEATDSIMLSFPRTVLPDVMALSESLVDRMHQLLERNADGNLNPVELEEVQTLVSMAQFGQIVALSLRSAERGVA